MKKTIAILLVLVIGMVGVWAAAGDKAVLTVNTQVAAFDEIKLVSIADNVTFAWGVVGAVNDGNNDYSSPVISDWDSTSEDDYKEVAYVHARSNRTGGFKVTAKATALSMTEGSAVYYIGYKVRANTLVDSVAADNTTTNLGEIFSITTNTGDHFSTGSTLVEVAPNGKVEDFRVGDYSATITFIVEAN